MAVGTWSTFVDCMVLRMVVEPGDQPLTDEAVHAIRYLRVASDAADIVLVGTPHFLTPGVRDTPAPDELDILTHVADTLDVLSNFAERLEEYGERVHLIPFGWNVAISAIGEPHRTPYSPLPGLRSAGVTLAESVHEQEAIPVASGLAGR
ncbi:hypothetical protein [Nocardia sp. NPDC019395]|uniref:hypothetical protein n=1 Tax=Nocardia sp. NPDC019395 TaxID=3154686 RepID=UPI0034079D38